MPLQVKGLLESTRPLRWAHEDETFAYTIGGSGFLVRFRKRHFLITARHCLDHHDLNHLCVEIVNNSGTFNALKQVSFVKGKERWHDLAFLEFDAVLNSPTELGASDFLDFDYLCTLPTQISTEAVFVFRGYPSELNIPDWEKKTLTCTSISMSGTWEPAATKPHCGAIRLDGQVAEFKIEDLDGVSGSPAFEFRHTTAGTSYKFAGVVFWGMGQIVRFIEAEVVFAALNKICI
jgi:hypothetical protein